MGFARKISRDWGRHAGLIVVVLLIVSLTALLGLSVFLSYRVVSPSRTSTEFTPDQLPSPPSAVVFSTPRGDRDGWFFPGLRGAPAVILAPGHGMHRGQLITLAITLQDNQYNAFVFEFTAQGSVGGMSQLGSGETQELLAAVETIISRDDVDKERIGIWGADLGGYAAVCAAAADQRVRAFAVDSVYDSPAQMFQHLLRRNGLAALPLVSRVSGWLFALLNFSARNDPALKERVQNMAGIGKFYVQARENSEAAEATRQLFLASPEPRDQLLVSRSRYAVMSSEERKAYETGIVTFFLQRLPPVQVAPRPAGVPR